MKQFLKFTLAAAFGIVLSFGLLIGLIAIVASGNETNEVKLSKPHILKLKLEGTLQDRVAENPFDVYGDLLGGTPSNIGLNALLANIKKAENDENISGIHLETGMLNAGFASLDELRDALLKFKESGNQQNRKVNRGALQVLACNA